MNARHVSGYLVVAAIVAGTASYDMRIAQPVKRGASLVIAADFHMHGAGADGILSPVGLLLVARHRGLGALAVTNHNQILLARITRWIARRVGGPTVLVGEEISAPGFHLIGVGLTKRVFWKQSAIDAIRVVHAQGGVAIAAHPFVEQWRAFDSAALRELDGAEVLHPAAIASARAAAEFRSFYERANADRHRVAAIGSSDGHWKAVSRFLRTQVFAGDESEAAILESVRNAKTVVFDTTGRGIGDPQLIAMLAAAPIAQSRSDERFHDATMVDAISRICGLAGLIGLVVLRVDRDGQRPHVGYITAGLA